jgi:undecaprenyl-diphosphatase
VAKTAEVVGAGYLVLTLCMLALGTMVTHLWDPSRFGRWDNDVNSWLAAHRIAMLDHVTSLATFFANTLPVVVLALLICVALALRRRWPEMLVIAIGLALEITVFLPTNYLVGRGRPHVARLDSTPSTASFPSGHVAASLVLWVSVALAVTACSRVAWLRIVVWGWAIAVPLSIAFARVYRGMHHVTDVAAGGALGIGCVVVAVIAVQTGTLTMRSQQ